MEVARKPQILLSLLLACLACLSVIVCADADWTEDPLPSGRLAFATYGVHSSSIPGGQPFCTVGDGVDFTSAVTTDTGESLATLIVPEIHNITGCLGLDTTVSGNGGGIATTGCPAFLQGESYTSPGTDSPVYHNSAGSGLSITIRGNSLGDDASRTQVWFQSPSYGVRACLNVMVLQAQVALRCELPHGGDPVEFVSVSVCQLNSSSAHASYNAINLIANGSPLVWRQVPQLNNHTLLFNSSLSTGSNMDGMNPRSYIRLEDGYVGAAGTATAGNPVRVLYASPDHPLSLRMQGEGFNHTSVRSGTTVRLMRYTSYSSSHPPAPPNLLLFADAVSSSVSCELVTFNDSSILCRVAPGWRGGIGNRAGGVDSVNDAQTLLGHRVFVGNGHGSHSLVSAFPPDILTGSLAFGSVAATNDTALTLNGTQSQGQIVSISAVWLGMASDPSTGRLASVEGIEVFLGPSDAAHNSYVRSGDSADGSSFNKYAATVLYVSADGLTSMYNETTLYTVTFAVPAGSGYDMRVTVCAGGQCSVQSNDTFSYPSGLPQVSSLSLEDNLLQLNEGVSNNVQADGVSIDCAVAGGGSVYNCSTEAKLTVHFNDSSTVAKPILLRVEGNNFLFGTSLVYVGSTLCPVVSGNSSRLVCQLPSGSGSGHIVSVQHNGLTFSQSSLAVSYGAPRISGLSTPERGLSASGCRSGEFYNGSAVAAIDAENVISLSECGAGGGETVYVFGRNFGPSGAQILVGGVACENVTHGVSGLSATAAGAAGTAEERVTVLSYFAQQVQRSDNGMAHRVLQCVLPSGPEGAELSVLVQSDDGNLDSSASAVAPSVTFAACPAGQGVDAATGLCTDCTAGRYSDAGSDGCQDCGAGRYMAGNGASACLECPMGQAASITGAIECTNCTVGLYAGSTGLSVCVDCPAGQFGPMEGLTACFGCGMGRFTNTSGLSDCLLCEKGTYSQGDLFVGSSGAQQAPLSVASYSVVSGYSACLQCISGRFSNVTGVSACAQCSLGRFHNLTEGAAGATVCKECPLGTYSHSHSRATCLPCSAGRFANVTGVSVCETCARGRFASGPDSTYVMGQLIGATLCEECATGKFVDTRGQASCSFCDVGTRMASTGASSCLDCAIGRYQDTTGQTGNCKSCPTGEYTDSTGNAVCLVCPSGSFQNDTRSSFCYQCSKGRFAAASGTSGCTDCPAGRFNLGPGRTSCDNCAGGQYLVSRDGSAECRGCPDGAVCGADGIVYAKKNFWLYSDPNSGAISSFVCVSGRCREGTACAGLPEAANASAVSCCSSNRRNSSTNAMCGECDPGYYEWGGACVSCDGTNVWLLLLLIAVLWLYVFIFHQVAQDTRADTKIFLYFVQMSLLFLTTETEWMNWLSVFNFDIFGSGTSVCLAELSDMGKLVLSLSTPFLCMCLLLVNFVIHKIIAYCRKIRPRGYEYVRTFFGLIIFGYNLVGTATLHYFDCVSINESDDVNRRYPSIDCNSSKYKNYMPLFVSTLCLIVIAFPLGLLAFLLYYGKFVGRHQLKKRWMLNRFGIVYEVYRTKRYYWEVFVLLRRIIIIATLLFMYTDRERRYMIVSVVNILFLALHMIMRPFQQYSDNVAESISLTLLSLITVTLGTLEVPLADWAVVVYSLTVLIPLAIYIVLILYERIRECFCAECTAKRQQQKVLRRSGSLRALEMERQLLQLARTNAEAAAVPWHLVAAEVEFGDSLDSGTVEQTAQRLAAKQASMSKLDAAASSAQAKVVADDQKDSDGDDEGFLSKKPNQTSKEKAERAIRGEMQALLRQHKTLRKQVSRLVQPTASSKKLNEARPSAPSRSGSTASAGSFHKSMAEADLAAVLNQLAENNNDEDPGSIIGPSGAPGPNRSHGGSNYRLSAVGYGFSRVSADFGSQTVRFVGGDGVDWDDGDVVGDEYRDEGEANPDDLDTRKTRLGYDRSGEADGEADGAGGGGDSAAANDDRRALEDLKAVLTTIQVNGVDVMKAEAPSLPAELVEELPSLQVTVPPEASEGQPVLPGEGAELPAEDLYADAYEDGDDQMPVLVDEKDEVDDDVEGSGDYADAYGDLVADDLLPAEQKASYDAYYDDYNPEDETPVGMEEATGGGVSVRVPTAPAKSSKSTKQPSRGGTTMRLIQNLLGGISGSQINLADEEEAAAAEEDEQCVRFHF